MPTFVQDYPPLPGSIHAAAHHARTVATEHQPGRVADAETIVGLLIADALTRTGPDGNIGLTTIADEAELRFEVRDPNTPVADAAPVPQIQARVSGLADLYGSDGVDQGPRRGHRVWVVLRAHRAAG
ncbi:hypothetical protein [Streptosporangium sp. NPDC004631]